MKVVKQKNIEMKKSNKTFGILIGILLVLFVIALFYVTSDTRSIVPFVKDNNKVLNEVLNSDNRISPIKVAKIIVDRDSSFVFVDIRSQYDFSKGHLPDAINIFKADILEKENLKFFKSLKTDNKKAVLYGNDVIEANTPFMILQQIGIENIALMEGGYPFFKNKDIKTLSEMGELDLGIEVAALDFAKLIKKEKIKATNIIQKEEMEKAKAKRAKHYIKKKKPVVTKKTVVTKKKQTHKIEKEQIEEEEDEGC